MLQALRNSSFSRLLWALLGLYFLNISVDTADLNPEFMPEDLSINDQESIIELVAEKVLGYEDAFQEYDDPASEDLNLKKGLKIESFIAQKANSSTAFFRSALKAKLNACYRAPLSYAYLEIDSPPPRS